MTNDPTDRRVVRALRSIAEDGPVPDELAAWTAVRRRATIRRRQAGRRRLAVLGGAVAAAAAAVVGVVVLDIGDTPQQEDLAAVPPTTAPPATAATSAPPSQPTFTGVPEHPLVVVSPDQRQLVLYDGETGARGSTLVAVGENERLVAPHVSADGRVLYTIDGPGGPTIGAVMLDGSVSVADPGIEGGGRSPTEANGLVAYVTPDGYTIRVVDERGQLVHELTGGAELDGEPAAADDESPIGGLELSPDGTRLAFGVGRSTYVVDVDAPSLDGARLLADDVDVPVWRDAETVLALAGGEVVSIDVDSGERERLELGPASVDSIAVGDAVYAVDRQARVWRDGQLLGVQADSIAVP